ncbi:MAG: kelch repeat-containing protein [Planctomycetota bacterium]
MPRSAIRAVLFPAAVAVTAASASAQLTWHRSTDAPAARCGHYAFYDAARGRVTVVGGQLTGIAYADDCWQLDGDDWVAADGPVVTGRGYGASCGFGVDGAVLFGGTEFGGSLSADMLRFDRPTLTFPLLSPAVSPPLRWITAMANDTARGRAVLFGGGDYSGPLGDTWEWNGANWQQRTPLQSPPARANHALAFDAARNRIVLFGGHDGVSHNDTWLYDGTTWTHATPPTSPPALHDTMLDYDAQRQVVVLFGGKDDTGTVHDQTWEWNGTTWALLSFPARPPARELASLTYDALRHRHVLFGGAGQGTVLLDDTWVYDGSAWTQLECVDRGTLVEPGARSDAMLVYDAVTNRTTMFGGRYRQGLLWQPLTDTWESAGKVWQRRTPVHSPPASFAGVGTVVRGTGAIVYFPGVDSFGTAFQEAWLWDGFDWTQRPLVNGALSQFQHQAVGSLQSSGYGWVAVRLVTTGGGLFLTNTVQLVVPGSGTVIPLTIGGAPSSRVGMAMAQMPNTAQPDRVWLYGGSTPAFGGGTTYHGDVWELADTGTNGALQWTLLAPAQGSPVPPARTGAAVTMMPDLIGFAQHGPQLLMVGGTGASGLFGDAWIFDITTRVWSQTSPLPSFTPRSGIALTFDNGVFGPPTYTGGFFPNGYDGGAIAFGGFDGATVRGEILDYVDVVGWFGRTTRTMPDSGAFAMCYDRGAARTLVLDHSCQTMWSYDGTAWRPEVGRGGIPAYWDYSLQPNFGADHVCCCFDESIGRAVFVHGSAATYGGGTWTDLGWTSGPGKRTGAAMVFVPSMQLNLYFGGTYAPQFFGGTTYNDTWTLAGATGQWAQIATTGPTPRAGHALACDRLRNRVVLFGGRLSAFYGPAMNDTWEFDAATGWQQRFPAHVPPAAAFDHSLVYDEARARTVLTGASAEIWEWDGTDWTQRTCENHVDPTGRHGVYDSGRSRCLAIDFGPTVVHEIYARIDSAGQGNTAAPTAMRAYSPAAAGQPLQLGFANPQGLGFYTIDFGPRFQPQVTLSGAPLCEPTNVYAQLFTLLVLGTVEPNIVFQAPNSPLLHDATLEFQAFALQPAGCLRATDPLHVRF